MLPLLKARLQLAQIRAGQAVNAEIVGFCWKAGSDLAPAVNKGRPEKLRLHLAEVSKELSPLSLEPGLCSVTNLQAMIDFNKAWPDIHYVNDRLTQLSWEHHIQILKVKSAQRRRALVDRCIEHGLSAAGLSKFIRGGK